MYRNILIHNFFLRRKNIIFFEIFDQTRKFLMNKNRTLFSSQNFSKLLDCMCIVRNIYTAHNFLGITQLLLRKNEGIPQQSTLKNKALKEGRQEKWYPIK